MNKLAISVIAAVFAVFIFAGGSIAQGCKGMKDKCPMAQGGMTKSEQCMMAGHGMMGMMMMDPEIKKMMTEHMKRCKQEMMQKMMSDPKVMGRMMEMMMMHKETVRQVLNENPEMKKELEDLTK